MIDVTGADVGIDFVPYDQAYEAGFEDMQRRVPDLEDRRPDGVFAGRPDRSIIAVDL